MQKKPIIGIYSGLVPSTTFIERLVNGLALSGCMVYHFGVKDGVLHYPDNVIPVTYPKSKLGKLIYYMKYWLLLSLFKVKEKKRLDNHLKVQGKNHINQKLRVYPVLLKSPDIVHIQWAKTIEDWMWVQEFGMKLILSLRGAHINYSPIANAALSRSYKENFPKLDGFHAVSQAISEEAQKYGANPQIIKVVYSGLDHFNDQLKIKEFKRPFTVISVGRDHWKKGYTYALDAIKQLKNTGLEVQYYIIGAAVSIELLYQIKDLQLETNVRLLPNLPYEDVQNMIASSDLLLLSSVEEGIANVVLEAMSLGTLVLSTDCGGMSEVIVKGENGFLVPVRDVMAMAKSIENISKLSKETTHKIASNALNTIRNQHSIEKMVKDMMELYTSTENIKNERI